MKKTLLIPFLLVSLLAVAQDLFMPPLNAKIISYVNRNIGKQVDSGECWDLANRALEYADAAHPDVYVFGKALEQGEEVYPGDIIQLENVSIKTPIEGGYTLEQITHHTAIVYEVLGELHFRVADQNNHTTGLKVGVHEMNLNLIEQGEYIIFRPVKP